MDSVSFSSGYQFMLLFSEHLLSVSIKTDPLQVREKNRYSEEKRRKEKKRRIQKKREEKRRRDEFRRKEKKRDEEKRRRVKKRREETCPINYGKFSYLEMQYVLNGIQ